VWVVVGVSGRNRGDVDLGRCLVAERLVGAPMVVEVEVARQPLAGLLGSGVIVAIDLLILHGAPEALGKDVVERAALAVHADLNILFLPKIPAVALRQAAATGVRSTLKPSCSKRRT